MNSMAKSSGGSEDHEKEDQNEHQPTLVTPLLSSSSSYHHHLQQRQQQQQQQRRPFFPPPPYNHHHGEPSNYHKEESWTRVEREQMFDKVVTPSDVGKLNRLVIPKQHAERYFPLDSSTNYKGLLLNFEDRDGKLWRFQYSYWNSSQSYVMTKGWSRFVKEKKLDAGDVVSFQRGVGNTAKDRLFIDWRRRVILNPSTQPPPSSSDHHLSFMFHNQNYIHQCNPLVLQSLPAWRNPEFTLQVPNYTNPNIPRSSRSVNYFEPDFNFQRQQLKMMQRNDDQIKKASGKRLRLFGVNMDCEFSEEEEDDDQDYDHQSPPSYSISTIPYFPLRPYEQETECSKISMLSSSSAHDSNIISKSTASGVSLDLKM